MALRYEHATQHRDRLIAEALESIARPDVQPSTGSHTRTAAAQDSVHSRTHPAPRVVGEAAEIAEIQPELGFPAAKVG
jgi:hypothetical protein